MNQRMSMSPRSTKSPGKRRKEKQKLNFDEYLGPLKSDEAGRDQRKAILKALDGLDSQPKIDTPSNRPEATPRNSVSQNPHKKLPVARNRDAESLADSIKGNFTMSNVRVFGQVSPNPQKPNNSSSPIKGRKSKFNNFSVDTDHTQKKADGSSTTGIAGFNSKFQIYACQKSIVSALDRPSLSSSSRSPNRRRPTFSKLSDWASTNAPQNLHKHALSTLPQMTSRFPEGPPSPTFSPKKARTSKSQGQNFDFTNSLTQTPQYQNESLPTKSRYYEATNWSEYKGN